jgi:hypothetical protein
MPEVMLLADASRHRGCGTGAFLLAASTQRGAAVSARS